MKKLRLELDELAIQSFEVAPEALGRRTVEAYSSLRDYDTCRGPTCREASVCGYDTCPYPCTA